MPIKNKDTATKRWTAAELRQLTPEQRETILSDAAALAEDDYRLDAALTAFEAFGKGDFYGDSSDSMSR